MAYFCDVFRPGAQSEEAYPMSRQTSFADILGSIGADEGRRAGVKLPAWAAVSAERRAAGLEPLEIPTALSLEQCSSEATAEYKRELLSRLFPGGDALLCDLTCGLGIDSLALSGIARRVISFERSEALAKAAERNFRRLGVGNIEVRNEAVGAECDLPECDIIFADPSRRDSAGRKLFRLADCSPDIRAMLPLLLERAGVILLKLSPMADISLVAEELGESLEEVHIVSLRSEVKELLCLLRRDHRGTYTLTARELDCGGSFSFTPEEEKNSEAAYAPEPQCGQLLLEPKAALMKSGAYRLVCSRFSVRKLAPSTHLYISGDADPQSFRTLFKPFRIVETLPFGRQNAKALGKAYPDAEVSARNLPLKSEELRRMTGVKGGGPHHIFGCAGASGRLLIVGETL